MNTATANLSRPISQILDDINRGRAGNDRIRAPMCLPTGGTRQKPVCFKFCSADGNGCTNNRCSFIHIDLQNPTWIRDNVPDTFLPEFLQFLDKPEVTPHFKATAALRTFLAGGRQA